MGGSWDRWTAGGGALGRVVLPGLPGQGPVRCGGHQRQEDDGPHRPADAPADGRQMRPLPVEWAGAQWEGHDTWEPVDQLQGSHVKGLINAYNEKLRNVSKS